MSEKILNPREMDFLLYEFLNTELLFNRPRYVAYSRDVFDVMLQNTRRVAEQYFANHYTKGDNCEPYFDGRRLHELEETRAAWHAVTQLGITAAHHDSDEGGLQLPASVCTAAYAYLAAANSATSSYHSLTVAAGNVIKRFASKQLIKKFVPPLMDGRYSGTMAFTEFGQGSSLADVTCVAIPQPDGSYIIKGEKAFVSNGEHTLSKNIIHLVLARIQPASAADDESSSGLHSSTINSATTNPLRLVDTQDDMNGVSLFVVPKILIDKEGNLGRRNNTRMLRSFKKMGCRNSLSVSLAFEGAEGYLLGKPNRGLHYSLKMMNEARINVGTNAAALAYQGYLHALAYARKRRQGRLPADKNSSSAQVRLIQHADVRRMLLMQKCYAEGAMALCLYASSLLEDGKTADTEPERQRATVLLDLLTPVVKSWPAKYGCIANDLALQVFGGYGYLRENVVEQLYRDQRLNPVQGGTEGIQALDLLARKVSLQNGYGFDIFKQEVRIALQRAENHAALSAYIEPINHSLDQLEQVTHSLVRLIKKDANQGLVNANIYLDLFGRIVLAWIWLRQAIAACRALDKLATGAQSATDFQPATGTDSEDTDYYQGKLQAARYYFDWELPQAQAQFDLLVANHLTCFEMQEQWF